jgi:hypothetical protein
MRANVAAAAGAIIATLLAALKEGGLSMGSVV